MCITFGRGVYFYHNILSFGLHETEKRIVHFHTREKNTVIIFYKVFLYHKVIGQIQGSKLEQFEKNINIKSFLIKLKLKKKPGFRVTLISGPYGHGTFTIADSF